MREMDLLRIQQLEDTLKPFRGVLDVAAPPRGWVRAIREALGMTNVQLAKRLGRKAPQTIEGMQEYEELGTIKLHTLREVAQAMGCRLVYAIVPDKPLEELRRARALEIARETLERTGHSMRLEAQGLSAKEEMRALERHVDRLLRGNPRRLWD